MIQRSSITAFCLFCLGACNSGTKPEETAGTTVPTHRTLNQRMSENNGYKQDANGNWKPQTDRRSSFETMGQDPSGKKQLRKREYQAGDFAKKSWWGNKSYGRESYTGNTDASRLKTQSQAEGKMAPETSTQMAKSERYDTATYATGDARERRGSAIEKGSVDEIENRRKVFQQPEVIDWREQRSLSLDESRGFLGR